MSRDSAARGPRVWFPPPLLFLGGYGIAWWLDQRMEFVIDGGGAGFVQTAIGTAVVSAGFGVMLWGIATFLLARTSIYPNSPARQFVVSGPYRYSRNPMYVGLAIAYIGGAVVLNDVWPLLLLPLVLLALYLLVIRREEAYLLYEFRDEYDRYRQRVRRWL